MTPGKMDDRQCTGCLAIKPLSAFAGDRSKSTGKASRCIECEVERARVDRQRPERRQQLAEARRRYRAEHYEQEKAYRLDRALTPKVRARHALRSAVAQGVIVKPSACQDCGRQGLIHGHHHDYSQPFAVEWLCTLCHGLRHRHTATPPPGQEDD